MMTKQVINKLILSGGLFAMLSLEASAQGRRTPLSEMIPSRELGALKAQESQLFRVLNQVIAPNARQVVAVRDGRNRWLASGTVVAEGKILSKWSEIGRGPTFIQDAEDTLRSAKVVKIDTENDLALLSAPGIDADTIDLKNAAESELGTFLVAAGMNGKAAAFGVTSVPARSLREEDMALLGIMTEESPKKDGLIIQNVPNGPARKAGIRGGDLLLKINDQAITGLFKLRKLLLGFTPGETIKVTVRRFDKPQTFNVQLGKRPEMSGISSRRLARMNRMGGNELSRQRDDYPLALQTDMIIKPAQAGAPVYNLDGQFSGIAIARAGRIESYVLPPDVIKSFLESSD